MIVAGILYVTLSLAFSNRSPAWRVACWVLQAAVFAVHIAYERAVRQSTVLATAFRTTLAVALGGFALAAYQLWRSARLGFPRSLYVVAVWPIATVLTAFVIAVAVASALRQKPAPSD